MSLINRYLSRSAAQWGISPNAARWLFWAPVVVSVLLPILRLDKRIWRAVLREDGPIEWATAMLFAVAFVAGLGAALALFKSRRRWEAALYLAFALVMFFCAGEEISWGQRILGFETPDALREINRQDEFTLHNIGQSLDVFKFLMFVGGGIGAAAYLANQRLRIQRFWADGEYLIIPPFFVASAFFLMFAFRLFRYIFFPNYQYTLTTYGEWIEFAFAYGFGVFAILVYRYVTAPRQVVVEAPVQVRTT